MCGEIDPEKYDYDANPEHQEWLKKIKTALKYLKQREDKGGEKLDTK